MKVKAIFLDRDGVINEDKRYVYKIENFEFVDGIFEVLKYLSKLKYRLYLVSNQSGIARGMYSLEDFNILTKYMISELRKQGIELDGVFYCPHGPEDNCECRKPKIGMIKDLLETIDLDNENSFMIGDKDSDIQFGGNLDVRTIRVISVYPKKLKANYEVDDLSEIMDIISD